MALIAVRQVEIDVDALVKEDRVHRLVYVEPTIFDLEMDRIFGKTWVFVVHESEVPNPGDFKTVYVGRVPVVVVRDEGGQIHVLVNRCRHRGAIVCREEYGNTSTFRCPYHGWTYGQRGELVLVPGYPFYGPEFDLSEFGLVSAPRVASYRGFVWASLSPEGNSLEEHLGIAREYLDMAIDEAPEGEIEVRSGVQRYSFSANWKFQLENWTDHSHAQIVHESAFSIRTRRGNMFPSESARPREDANGRPDGNGSWHGVTSLPRGINTERTRGGLGNPDPAYLARLSSHVGLERARDLLSSEIQLMIFPNFFIQPRRHHFRTLRPIAVDRTEVYAYPYTLKGAAEDVNRRLVPDVAWWASAAGFGQPDDLECLTRCQEGLQAPQPEWVLLMCGLEREEQLSNGEIRGIGENEATMRGIHREWKRLMRNP